MTSSSKSVITGKAIFHLYSCPVRAWLFLNGCLIVDIWNQYIKSGTKLDNDRWKDKRALDLSPYGKCDWITGTTTKPIIHEGSRAKIHTEAKRAQLRHYLWAAKERYGIEARGQLHLAKGRTEWVELDKTATLEDHEKLHSLCTGPMPKPKWRSICKGCTNMDWCWG